MMLSERGKHFDELTKTTAPPSFEGPTFCSQKYYIVLRLIRLFTNPGPPGRKSDENCSILSTACKENMPFPFVGRSQPECAMLVTSATGRQKPCRNTSLCNFAHLLSKTIHCTFQWLPVCFLCHFKAMDFKVFKYLNTAHNSDSPFSTHQCTRTLPEQWS